MTNSQLATIFVVSILVGGAVYVMIDRDSGDPDMARAIAPDTQITTTRDGAPAGSPPARARRREPVASAEPPTPAAQPPAEPVPAAPPRASSNINDPMDGDRIATRAERLATREHFTRAQIRNLIEETVSGKLPDRELAPADYDRLTDAVLRLRAAQRVLRGIEDSAASASILAARREQLVESLAVIRDVTGLTPDTLGGVLTAGEPLPEN